MGPNVVTENIGIGGASLFNNLLNAISYGFNHGTLPFLT